MSGDEPARPAGFAFLKRSRAIRRGQRLDEIAGVVDELRRQADRVGDLNEPIVES